MTNYIATYRVHDTYTCEDGSIIVVDVEKKHDIIATVYRYTSAGLMIGSIELREGYHGCKYVNKYIAGMAYEATSMLWEFARFAGTKLTDEDDELADRRAETYIEACELEEKAAALLRNLN